MKLLLIAPNAPPKNSAESIQVARFLAALDPAVRVTLVTTPIVRGWVWQDSTLTFGRPGLQVITPALPFHRLSQRILSNRRFSALHIPDADFWLPWYAKWIGRQLKDKPDVIYSRSAPFSAALLARRLKGMFGCPWLMHLSDPWADSPYRVLSGRGARIDRSLEASCFANADCIALTTDGQADFYRSRYPSRKKDILVTPNMMPNFYGEAVEPNIPMMQRNATFRLVYTGAIYGTREPSTLLAALQHIQAKLPEVANQINVDFYGNISPEITKAIDSTPCCKAHGVVSFQDASHAQMNADVLLTIEPSGSHPLLLHFMPSKNLDYISLRKPILAITPSGSETARLCNAGQGWAVSPRDYKGLAKILVWLTRSHINGISTIIPPDPAFSPYKADLVSDSVVQTLRNLSQLPYSKARN